MTLVWAGLVVLAYGGFAWLAFVRTREVLRAGKTGQIRAGFITGRVIHRSREPGPFRKQVIKNAVFSILLIVPLLTLGNFALRTVLGAIARQ